MTGAVETRRRGTPLVALGFVLAVWSTGRIMLWESPFALPEIDLPSPHVLIAKDDAADQAGAVAQADANSTSAPTSPLPGAALGSIDLGAGTGAFDGAILNTAMRGYSALAASPQVAAGHHYVMTAAFGHDFKVPGFARGAGVERMSHAQLAGKANRLAAFKQSSAPFLAQPSARQTDDQSTDNAVDRWSLDAIAFYRSGSSSLSSVQGRAPVYGASQLAANLQYRIAPQSAHDPRAYARAYNALVEDGETELAAGLSARPVAAIPLRTAAELRVTRNRFNTEVRPAAYAVSELPPQRLPLGLALEAYASAGYVAGNADTFFADGQLGITREIANFKAIGEQPVRISLGGASWGGAQVDANRLDVGPTLRFDLTVGEVPARVSVDWRERVAGDAEPTSGVAATLSTRF